MKRDFPDAQPARRGKRPTNANRGSSGRSKPNADLHRLGTEKPNAASADLDLKSALQIVRIINAEDTKVASAVRRALPQIARAVDAIASALSSGGRLIYVGTGTSGRIAALDAAELPPTFAVPRRVAQFVIAGGTRALASAVEGDEDSRELGRANMAKKNPGEKDVVIGIAASGRTPFTITALEYARRCGAQTVAVVCNRNSPLAKMAHIAIVAEVGPEVIAGSTRMKAGTAQKMILNMLSTGAMARMGHVYGNLMVNVRARNSKLLERGVGILRKTAGLSRSAARRALSSAEGSVPVALVMAKCGMSRDEAIQLLRESQGRVRRALLRADLRV